MSDRVDLGAWGGLNPHANYGLVGIDSKIALLRQGPGRPVSISIRPSVSSLVGPSEVWAASASLDVSVSRAFGPISPYEGVATSASLAVERSNDVDVVPATAEGGSVYAGLAYRWRTLLVSAEVETGTLHAFGPPAPSSPSEPLPVKPFRGGDFGVALRRGDAVESVPSIAYL